MGMIAAATPYLNVGKQRVSRFNVTVAELTTIFKRIPIISHQSDQSVWKTEKYEDHGVKIINDDMAHLSLLSPLPKYLHIPRVG